MSSLTNPSSIAARHSDIDSPYAWVRLAASVALGTIGGVGLWSMPVVMSSVQAEFGVLRADASLPFTLTMLGFACGGVAMGRLQDRFGILAPARLAFMLPLLLLLRRPAPRNNPAQAATARSGKLGLSPGALHALLCIAGLACCVAMAMPQVHIVAYCGDLGYGVARGAEMLSLMMAFGIVSRIGSGYLADKIGGLRTLLIGSVAQGFALLFYVFFDSLSSLFIISAMFGLFQGGIVPSYAIIVRESIPAREAATRVGIVIFASVFGMSFGGWISGVIFDATGSYAAAFANGVAWNAVNVAIVLSRVVLARRRPVPA